MNQTIHPPRVRKRIDAAQLCAVMRRLLHPDRAPLYFLIAAVLTFAVESLSRRSPAAAVAFLLEAPLAYLANFGIILCTSLLFRKRMAGMALTTAFWGVLGIAQCITLLSRVTPLSAADIAVALSVITIISAYFTPLQFALICIALIGVIAGLVMLFIRAKRHKVRLKAFLSVYLPTVAITVLIFVGAFTTGQLSDHFPNLATAYDAYGFSYCFSMSVVDKGVDRPLEYGEELITGILGELLPESDPAPVAPDDGTGSDDRAPNVILVQLESFFDVQYIEGVTYSADPTPTFTMLKEQYPSGLFFVPVIGAGTVNTEFEVLTGMNVADFGAGEYPFRSILLETTCETIAYDLLASGYRTHAIHNHEGSFYLRNEVYKNLGFEDFTSIEYFEDPTFNENGWAHDALLTDEILHLLGSTEESDFVFAVSVQGHGKYPDDYSPAPDDILVTGGMEDEVVRSHYNYYINQLHEMDAFIAELYAAVMAMEEDTVLVLYGDHLPSIACAEGITIAPGECTTEYVIIANYETPAPAEDRDLYTYQLFPAIMQTIGNGTGVMNNFHRTYADDPKYLELLSALEYDILYGRRMAYGDTEYPVMTHMQMGSRPISVSGVTAHEEYLLVRGRNFTPYSVVTLDGRDMETEFVDANTLRIPLRNAIRELEDIDLITIRQICDKGETLSETKPYRVPHPSKYDLNGVRKHRRGTSHGSPPPVLCLLARRRSALIRGDLIQLIEDFLCECTLSRLLNRLIVRHHGVLLVPDDSTELVVEAGERRGVDDARIDVDVVDDHIQHLSRLEILCDLGAQGGLIVGGLDRGVADGAECLQHGADLMATLTVHRGGNGDHRELVVHQSAVRLLLRIVLRHGNHTEFVLHVADHAGFQLQEPNRRHGRIAVGEHIADEDLLAIQRLRLENVSGILGFIEETEHLLGHVVQLACIKGHLIHTVAVLFQNIDHAGAPVGIHADVGIGDETVDIPLLILHTVAVVTVEHRHQLDLAIQRPGTVLDILIEVRNRGISKEILVEDRNEGEAIHGEQHGARSGILRTLIFDHFIIALRPPGLFQIQIVGLPQIAEGAVEGLVEGGVAGGGHDVVLMRSTRHSGGHLIDHDIRIIVVLLDSRDLDMEAILDILVPFEHRVIDQVSVDLLHRDLSRGPTLTVTADDHDLVVLIVQIIRQIVGKNGFALRLRNHGITSHGGIGRPLVIGGTGGKGREKHQRGKQRAKYTVLLHDSAFLSHMNEYTAPCTSFWHIYGYYTTPFRLCQDARNKFSPPSVFCPFRASAFRQIGSLQM